jgi:hypothetical protein
MMDGRAADWISGLRSCSIKKDFKGYGNDRLRQGSRGTTKPLIYISRRK